MEKFFLALLKIRLPLVLILVGLVAMIIAAAGCIPVFQECIPGSPSIDGAYRIILFIVGFFLLTLGAYGCFLDMCSKPVFGSKTRLAEQTPVQYEGELRDLFVGNLGNDDSQKIVPMGQDPRVWSYELSDVEVTTSPGAIRLTFKADVLTQRLGFKEHYVCDGEGPFTDGVGYLTYSFKKAGKPEISWLGVMVLRVSKAGAIQGFWMTTNVYESPDFPMGTITLKRKA